MAVPRVFISSTYYDMKQVRNNIGDFIKSLGYEAVMHERSSVAYTQNDPLEEDCYHELVGCDIIVCIIGNHFGTQSSDGDLSITMRELQTAIKAKKKIYVFISNDVYIENRTYKRNKDNENFQSAYTDDVKIHKYIAELTDTVRNHVITPFDTTDQIISVLKSQFAGLFQNLLVREASLTDAKTAYDLQESSDTIRRTIGELREEQDSFFRKFESTIFACNMTVQMICRHIGISKATIFVPDVEALDEIMQLFGFTKLIDLAGEDYRQYTRDNFLMKQVLVLKKDLFNNDGTIKDIRSKDMLEKCILWTTEGTDYSQLPF